MRDGRYRKIVIGAQHTPVVDGLADSPSIQRRIEDQLVEELIRPALGAEALKAQIVVNGSGSFAIGGPAGDAGVVGRKVVCDAYGPAVPVGGGAFSGKDPTKVDRSAAYMARYIARSAVLEGVRGAKAVRVALAYAIGGHQPEMVAATTQDGSVISDWVVSTFPDLAPASIAEHLGLWGRGGGSWTYASTAFHGHFGRAGVPWEGQSSAVTE